MDSTGVVSCIHVSVLEGTKSLPMRSLGTGRNSTSSLRKWVSLRMPGPYLRERQGKYDHILGAAPRLHDADLCFQSVCERQCLDEVKSV